MFILTPFVIDMLDKTGFGIWRLAVVFVGYYGFLNLAVSSSITRYVARDAGRGDSQSLNETVSTAMAIYLFSAVLAIGISFAFADSIVNFFDKTPLELVDDFKHVIWILGISSGINFIQSFLSAIVTAHEQYVVINLTGIVVNLLRAFLTILFLIMGWGLVGVAWANLIPTAVALLVNYIICRRFTPMVKITLMHARIDVLNMLMAYGVPTMVISLANMLRTQVDSTVIGKMLGFEEVAIYGVAASLIGQISSFTAAGIAVLQPRFASLDGRGHVAELRKVFVKSLHYSALLSFGLCILAFIWGGNFIRLWVGAGFNRSIPILWILSLAWIFDLAQCPGVGMMYALNKHKFYAGAFIVEGVLNFGLSLLLVRGYGIIGVALGTAIPMIALRVFIQPIYVARIAGLSLREYAQPFILPFVSSGLVVAGCYVVGAFSNDLAEDLLTLGIYGAVTAVLLATINIGLSRLLGKPGIPMNY